MNTNVGARSWWLAVAAMVALTTGACGGGTKKAVTTEATSAKTETPPDTQATAAEPAPTEPAPTDPPTTATLPPAPALMPRLVGLTETVARSQLAKAGVSSDLIVVKPQESISTAGMVVNQVPSEGVEARGAVTLFVSVAPAPMTSFVGKPIGDLRTFLEARGITLRIESVLDDAQPEGTVVEHSPGPGEALGPEVLVKVTAKPVTLYLVDLKSVQQSGSFDPDTRGEVAVNGQVQPRSLLVGDYYGQKGPWWEYDLSRDWRFFRATVGVSDLASADSKIRLDVFGDGNPIYSKEFALGSAEEIDVDVTGRLRLRIQITGSAHQGLVIGNARLVGSPDQVASSTVAPN